MKKQYSHIVAKLINQPWLIEDEWLNTMIDIVNSHESLDPKALELTKMDSLSGARKARYQYNVAVANVSGPIYPKANMMTEFCGAQSLELFMKDFKAAEDNQDIDTFIGVFDSPGGVVTGISESAQYIRNSSLKTVAFISGSGASAAYWLPSAFDEIVMADTAYVGSIGVVCAYRKQSKNDSIIEFVSTQSPNKRVDPETESGKKEIIERLDDLAGVFISSVAMYRGVEESVVTEKFGKGGVLVGQKAVDAGMADRIGTFETLLEELTKNGDYAMNLEELKAKHPEVYQAAFNEGSTSAKTGANKMNEELGKELVKVNQMLTDTSANLKSSEEALASAKDENKKLKREEDIRAAKETSASAKSILSKALATSGIPKSLHAKVSVDHEAHVSDEGKFDVAAYEKAVGEEVGDWAKSFSGKEIQGTGDFGDEGNNTSADESDKKADELLAMLS